MKYFFLLFLLYSGINPLYTQNLVTDDPSSFYLSLEENAPLVLKIHAKIITPPNEVIWEQELYRETSPGQPVRLKIEGGNLQLNTHFTPVFQGEDSFLLVAQGQLWIQNQTATQFLNHFRSIPCRLGETVVFFPLGMIKDDLVKQATIAVELTLLLQESNGEE